MVADPDAQADAIAASVAAHGGDTYGLELVLSDYLSGLDHAQGEPIARLVGSLAGLVAGSFDIIAIGHGVTFAQVAQVAGVLTARREGQGPAGA